MLVLTCVLRTRDWSPWWLALYAWHPLALDGFAASGHQDVIGIALMFPSFGAFGVVAGMIVYFTAAARFEEAKFKRSPLAADYEAFVRRTGRFIPKFR